MSVETFRSGDMVMHKITVATVVRPHRAQELVDWVRAKHNGKMSEIKSPETAAEVGLAVSIAFELNWPKTAKQIANLAASKTL